MTENKLAVKKETVLSLSKNVLGRMMNEVEEFAKIEKTPLTDNERSFALEIIEDINKKVTEGRVAWQEIDIVGCSLYSQVKSFARMGLSPSSNELYIDIRNNKYTGKKDIYIKKQYQGVEKELIKWSKKEIVRFLKDIVCKGDDFVMETDFLTGLPLITKHIKNQDVDRNDLENMTGAYAIAYVKEHKDDKTLTPYVIYIDRNRILRAYNASPTGTKVIWKADTAKMVIKTAVWELHNYFKPFIAMPVELKKDWEKTNEKMEWQDTEAVVEEEIQNNANAGEVIDFERKEIEVEKEEETPETDRGF